MTSTLCQSAALERIIALWTATIAVFLLTIVKTILTIAEIMGRHARLLRHGRGFLPPSARALYAAIGATAWITGNRKVGLDVLLSAQLCEAWQAMVRVPRAKLRVTIQVASGRSVLT